ncbi:MAG: DUF1570 domain-containing protein [Planctomycetota bacterium]
MDNATITFFCEKCTARFDVASEKIGKQFICNKCHQVITVPEESQSPPQPVVPKKKKLHERIRDSQKIILDKVAHLKKRRKTPEKKSIPLFFWIGIPLILLVLGLGIWKFSGPSDQPISKSSTKDPINFSPVLEKEPVPEIKESSPIATATQISKTDPTQDASPLQEFFKKESYQQKQKEKLVVASSHLSTQEFQNILNSGEKILQAFFKEYESDLDPLYGKKFPPFFLAVFSSLTQYQSYCREVGQPRAANEAGLFFPEKRLLVSTLNIFMKCGEAQVKGNPGELLNTAILYAGYLESSKEAVVIPKMNLFARTYLGDQYYAILTNHYYVAMQNSDSYLSKMAIIQFVDLLEQTYDWIYTRYREEWNLREYDHLMSLFIFKNRKEYIQFEPKVGPGTAGFYRPSCQQMFTYRQPPGDTTLESTIIHEGTHMIMHYFCGFRDPKQQQELFWFQEGIAEFFGSWKRDPETGKLVLEQLNKERFGNLWSKVVRGKHRSFKEILPISVVEKYLRQQSDKELEGDLYEQGWGMVHFFMHAQNGKYRKPFYDYIRSFIAGKSDWKTFKTFLKIQSDQDLQQMEDEFKEHIKTFKREK